MCVERMCKSACPLHCMSWLFSRAAQGKAVLVQCVLIMPRDIAPAAVASRVQQAAADFAPIVKSIVVEAIAP